ncbi:flagellar motor switch protein FliM [Bacillota bacterium LX-D]|nr:flagellar motor switch protein FliM [Bacillota bacterium LX-D]
MDEVLSQSEIDMLLNALTSGDLSPDDLSNETEAGKVKEYDFRRPNKFSKDQMRTLYLIYDNFARVAANFLSAYLRVNIQVKIASVEQLTYEDFVLSVPTPTLLTIFTMEPLPGSAILETNSGFIFPIIDLLFGGPGAMPAKLRELTDIESNVLKNLYKRLLENVNFVWSDIFEIQTNIQSTETNPQLSQIISPNETVVTVTLSTKINDNQGLINFCLPFMLLEPVLPKLTARHWFTSIDEGEAEVYKQKIRHFLDRVELDLEAVYGQTKITVRDFLNLHVGDVITLDNQVGQDMNLLVGDLLKFKVQPGMTGKKLAVQITAFAKEAE